jgi:hypothetical protein
MTWAVEQTRPKLRLTYAPAKVSSGLQPPELQVAEKFSRQFR